MKNPQPVLMPDPETGLYVLVEKLFAVPAGFAYDGASIPRFAWALVGSPFDPTFMKAALFHDFNYQRRYVSRRTTDRLFYLMLRANGVVRIKSWIMWAAVRAFGWMHWKK